MHELVKKKNWGYRILIGILILFAITQALKFFFTAPKFNINDELVQAANEINKLAPIVVDSVTTFNNVTALRGNIFQYNYTVMVEKSSVDTITFIKIVKESFLEHLKNNPKASYFRDNKIEIHVNYADKNRGEICEIVVLPGEY